MEDTILLLVVGVAVAGVFGQWLGWRLKLPAIIPLLAIGAIAGPVAGVVKPSAALGEVMRPAIGMAVAIIVFEGGLNLNLRELRSAGSGVLRLVGVALPLNWLFGTLAARFVAEMSWSVAVLVGAILVVTGPTVIMPLLRQAKLEPRSAAFLKWEAIVNDPIGATITLLVLSFLTLSTTMSTGDAIVRLAWRTLVGGGIAAALGVVVPFGIRTLFRRDLAPEYLKTASERGRSDLAWGTGNDARQLAAERIVTGGPDPRAGPARWFSFALLAVAGWTDAVGFLLFAGLYVSFMSGDATQLGVTGGEAHWPGVAKFLAAQIVFVVGAALGRAVGVRVGNRHRPVLLGVIAALLVLAAVEGNGTFGFVAAVLGMGMLNEVMHTAAGVPVGTMITGTLVRLGEDIADRLAGRPAPVGENAGQWAAFVIAAVLGTLAYHRVGAIALAMPALGCAILGLAAARFPPLRTRPPQQLQRESR